jgi:hypothetical protein
VFRCISFARVFAYLSLLILLRHIDASFWSIRKVHFTSTLCNPCLRNVSPRTLEPGTAFIIWYQGSATHKLDTINEPPCHVAATGRSRAVLSWSLLFSKHQDRGRRRAEQSQQQAHYPEHRVRYLLCYDLLKQIRLSIYLNIATSFKLYSNQVASHPVDSMATRLIGV